MSPAATSFEGKLRQVEAISAGVYGFVNDGNIEAADLMLNNIWSIERYDPIGLPADLTWTEDPYEEPYWRFVFYSLRPTRHLLWAYFETGDIRYRDALVDVLADFVDSADDSPYLEDLHGTAYRGLILTNSLVNLRAEGAVSAFLDTELLDEIAATAEFLARPDHFQGAYNHGMTQAVALVAIGHYFPELVRSQEWMDLGLARIDETLSRNVGTDGVQVENSPFYHFYVMRLGADFVLWAEQEGIDVPSQVMVRLDAMLGFATHIVQPNGQIPLTGSSVALDARRFDADADLHFSRMNSEFEYIATGGVGGDEPGERAVLFGDSGIAILRSGFGAPVDFPGETHIVFDVGEYRTNHSQADALSMNLYSAGLTLVTDAGLFTYEAGADFDWFEGTMAHNTVVVDGRSQGDDGQVAAGATIVGSSWAYQSGVHSLFDGVEHWRGVLLLLRDVVLVVDRLSGDAVHEYSQIWHFNSGLEGRFIEDEYRLSDVADRPVLRISQSGNGLTASAVDSWVSETYEHRVPNEAVSFTAVGENATFVSLFTSGPYANSEARIEVVSDGADELVIDVCTRGSGTRVILSGESGVKEGVSVVARGTCGFDGHLPAR